MHQPSLGIFNRGNYCKLELRVDNHPPPAEEDCPDETFREIWTKLTPEQQDLVQWNVYCPQRAIASYRVKLPQIDLTRTDYAIVTILATVGINKARVQHPCFPPIEFANHQQRNSAAEGALEVDACQTALPVSDDELAPSISLNKQSVPTKSLVYETESKK